MSRENCNDCAYRCSCRGIRKAQAAALGYCFDYEKEDSWSNRVDLLLNLVLGVGLSAILITVVHICGFWR